MWLINNKGMTTTIVLATPIMKRNTETQQPCLQNLFHHFKLFEDNYRPSVY